MRIRIRLSNSVRKSLMERLHQAYAGGHIRLVKRIHALLAVVDGDAVAEVATLLHLGEQTIRDYVQAFIAKGVDSLHYQKPSGCPPKLTKTQRKELQELISAGPEAAGYPSGCWTATMLQDLILCRFGVAYHPHYVCALLDRLGFSFQKARFVSDHLDEEARCQWHAERWPEILRLAQEKQALLLFGDEASFAQWGSLAYTWALKGQQPTVKTSGKRKAYKVFGLIDYFSGRFFSRAHTGRFNSDSYAAFLAEVLAQTKAHIILIQDGAKYHTSRQMRAFFTVHTDRLTRYQLPSYSPDFNPIEFLWKKIRKRATHLKFFAEFAHLVEKVDEALQHFASMPSEITSLMGMYCASLGQVS
jgi:transposase